MVDNVGSRLGSLIAAKPEVGASVQSALGLPDGVELADLLEGRYEPSLTQLLFVADEFGLPLGALTGELPLDSHLGASLRLGRQPVSGVAGDVLETAEMMLSHRAVLDAWEAPGQTRRVLVSNVWRFKDAGRETALRVRDLLGVGIDPIPDLVGTVESFGVPVAFRSLPPEVAGINFRDARSGPVSRVIFVSVEAYWTRQRYTLAHEFCHSLFDDPGQVLVDTYEVPEIWPELRAEAFARHLLLPEDALAARHRDWLEGDSDVAHLVTGVMVDYGVSRDVVLGALTGDGLMEVDSLQSVEGGSVRALMVACDRQADWDLLRSDQHLESGSPWLVDRALKACRNGWVDVRLVADLMGGDRVEVEERLISAGWLPMGDEA